MFIHFKCTNWLLKIYIKCIIVLTYCACFNLINCIVVSYMLNDCGSVVVCYGWGWGTRKDRSFNLTPHSAWTPFFDTSVKNKSQTYMWILSYWHIIHTALECNQIQCWPLGGSTAMRWEQHQQPLKETHSSLQTLSLLTNMKLYQFMLF